MIKVFIIVGSSLLAIKFISKKLLNGSEPSIFPNEKESILPMMLVSCAFSILFGIYLVSQAYGQEFVWELYENAKLYLMTYFE